MSDQAAHLRTSMKDLLSKVSRYEALFELTGEINSADNIKSVSEVLARRLKYITDVYSWRYLCFEGEPEDQESKSIVVDGYRGQADVLMASPVSSLSFEVELWRDRKTCILCGEPMRNVMQRLPQHFQKDDLEQISINVHVRNGKTQSLFIFCKRRQPFTELDIKCLTMTSDFFHQKIIMLWEQQKMRDLEQAYLHQEVMLRQSERLATLGRLSAGMAHELNNPTAVARHAADQLSTTIARLDHARFALDEASLSTEQNDFIAMFEKDAKARAKQPSSLDPIARSDLEQEVEAWLQQKGVDEPWQHASTLVAMGFCTAELEDLTKSFDSTVTPLVIDYFGNKFTTNILLEEIGDVTGRIVEIIKALKGYSFMDQAPVQAVDVREGLNDTLVMLNSKLRKGVKVNLDFAETLPRIQGHGSELNQVWTNLIDNAISAMGGEGKIELRAYQDDDWVVVEVVDNGPGIPIEAQEKIFDPFYTTKAPGEGTGLGLNISHGIIVEKHDGQISVMSKPGMTCFNIKLPIMGNTSAIAQEGEILTE